MSIDIVQGENSTFDIKLRDSEGDPFDLTNFDEYTVCLPLTSGTLSLTQVANANGSLIALSGNALLGKLNVSVNSVDTTLLKVADRQDIGLELNNNGTPNPRRQKFAGVLNVTATIC